MMAPASVRAVRISGPDTFAIETLPVPEVGPGLTLVAPAFVGLCGTDLDLFDGSMPYLHQGTAWYPLQPGHEWAGTILEDSDAGPTGTPVIMDPMVGCGRCERCAQGMVARCPDRYELGVRNGLDGAMATALAVPTANLLRVPEAVSLRDAALAEPMVTPLEGIRRTDPRPGEEVLVVGAGTLGLVAAMILSARGLRTHVLMRNAGRVATVEAAGGIPWVAGSRAGVEQFDVVIEAAGTPGGIQASLAHVAPGGRVAWLGVPTIPVEIDAAAVAVRDITIKGVLNGPGRYPDALTAIAAGEVRPDLLIDRVYAFDDIAAALARTREPGRARPKVLIAIDEWGRIDASGGANRHASSRPV
jgi:threonine dehydrogenase-like Zn-dependent dehydrogenase